MSATAPAPSSASSPVPVPVPALRKAARIQGKGLVFRNAAEADAAFILSLRTDERKAKHLSRTSPALADQEAWLRSYAQSSSQAYFIIESLQGEPLGTVRLYDARGTSFCWGSWILKDGRPNSAAVESALMVYAYAVGTLGFEGAHFQVHPENARVCAFHERFGAVRVHETADEIEYTLSPQALHESLQRMSRFLPDGIHVEF